jgi:hypothetical protein
MIERLRSLFIQLYLDYFTVLPGGFLYLPNSVINRNIPRGKSNRFLVNLGVKRKLPYHLIFGLLLPPILVAFLLHVEFIHAVKCCVFELSNAYCLYNVGLEDGKPVGDAHWSLSSSVSFVGGFCVFF